MIDKLKIEPFLELVDRIWVHQPSSVIFVCGGPTENDMSLPPPSLREAFFRVGGRKGLKKYHTIKAEDVTRSFELANYKDILMLEADIAEISSLVLLFSESYGSAAELGAFSFSDAISDKLLTVIDNALFIEDSFVKLGPLRRLLNKVGESAICVINAPDIGVQKLSKLDGIDLDAFYNILNDSISHRIGKIETKKSFNNSIRGHVILLIVGIIQWYGALTLEEVDYALMCLGCQREEEEIANFLLCAEVVGWIKKATRGRYTFFAAANVGAAVGFSWVKNVNKERWQASVRELWMTEDAMRFNLIRDMQEVV